MQQRFLLRVGLISLLTMLAACQGETAVATASEPSTAAQSSAGASDEVVTHAVSTTIETVDGQRVLVATVTPQSGYKINLEYPRWGVQVADNAPAAAGVRVGREEATTFAEEQAVFRIPIVDGAAAGAVEGTLRISVCDEEACLMPTETVQWELTAAN